LQNCRKENDAEASAGKLACDFLSGNALRQRLDEIQDT
jgi:hypothetical protein